MEFADEQKCSFVYDPSVNYTLQSDPIDCASPTIKEEVKSPTIELLPVKSRQRYEAAYNEFIKWRATKNIESCFSEDVLMVYFGELAEKMKSSTLWAQYSMLRSTMAINHNVDMSTFTKLKALLQRKSQGYRPKKSKILTPEDINKFVDAAPNDKYLFVKIALVVGVTGACRKQELVQLKIDDITDLGTAALFNIQDIRTNKPRLFTIAGEFYEVYKHYAALRPANMTERRFFLNYQNGKCTKQPVGINKIGSIPKQVATFLKLNNPELYTGHCFRRSSATIPIESSCSRLSPTVLTTLASQFTAAPNPSS
ncbi:uncharacterized protein LOC116173590 [Photinus pyralis]|nr:uncharacterized protein LOC116173590 [Photinus pyralis]XP_031347065.1 uncharacterized protein LOC116173590 [Photinus pyralis]